VSPFEKEQRRFSHELLLRELSKKGIQRYLDGRELQMKPKISEMWH
jgi:hypothetical protein